MKLFGPILFYDMLRMARRSRYIVLRCLYALLLLLLMYPVYQMYFHAQGPFSTSSDPARTLTLFGETFFYVFMSAQYIVILLVTPAYVAGAIADEKHRRTLEYILATDLHNREIVLGKYISRLANLALFLISGMPILSLNLLFGGVSAELLLCGFAATAVTMMSLAALSILQSVYARRVRDAVTRTYVIMIGYFALWGLLMLLREFLALDKQTPPEVFVTIDTFLQIYNAGNPALAILELVRHVRGAGTLGTKPFELLGYFSIFHGVVTLLCLSRAVLRVRSVYVRQAFGKDTKAHRRKTAHRPQRTKVGAALAQARAPLTRVSAALDIRASRWSASLLRPVWRSRRPAIGNRPMLWKEFYFERTLRLGMLGELAFAFLILVCFIPVFIIAGVAMLNCLQTGWVVDEQFQRQVNGVVRLVGTILASFVLVGTAIRAANSIGAEQNRHTFETLLATPMSNFEIVSAKWLGSALSQRWVFGLLAVVWVLGAAAAGLHLLAIPAVLLTLAVLVAFMTSLGLALATRARTPGRAATAAVVLFLALCGLPWLLKLEDETYPCAEVLSPPRLLFAAAFWQGDVREAELARTAPASRRFGFQPPTSFDRLRIVLFPAIGLVLYGVAAALLWFLALAQFRERCGRIIRRPPRTAAPPPQSQLPVGAHG